MDALEQRIQRLENQYDDLKNNQIRIETTLKEIERKANAVPELDKRLTLIEERLQTIHSSLTENVNTNKLGFKQLSDSIQSIANELNILKTADDKRLAETTRNLKRSALEKIIGYLVPLVMAAIIGLIFKVI